MLRSLFGRGGEPVESVAVYSPGRMYLNLAGKVLLGIVIPVALLWFDPFVFSHVGDSMMGSLSSAAYIVIVLSMAAFLMQLIPGRRPAMVSYFLAGAMVPGLVVACLMGIVILPISVVGILVYGIGLLGLYPFIFGALYFRSVRSAFLDGSRNDGPRGSEPASHPLRWRMLCGPIAGFVMVMGIAALLVMAANLELDRLAAAARRGDLRWIDWRRERFLTWAGDVDRIAIAFKHDSDSEPRNDDLAVVYHQLTHGDVEARLYQLAHPD
jgi:hypothetical protein